MKWLFVAVVIIVAVGGLAGMVALIGMRLPRAHVSQREIQVAAPPDVVWQTITNVDGFSTWRADVSRVERLPDRGGKATWVEHGSNGRITYTIDRAEPPRVLVVRIADPDLPFGGTWTYELAPAGAACTVRITEHGEIYNPVFRFMARYVFGYEGTIKAYLASLEKKLAAAV